MRGEQQQRHGCTAALQRHLSRAKDGMSRQKRLELKRAASTKNGAFETRDDKPSKFQGIGHMHHVTSSCQRPRFCSWMSNKSPKLHHSLFCCRSDWVCWSELPAMSLRQEDITSHGGVALLPKSANSAILQLCHHFHRITLGPLSTSRTSRMTVQSCAT